MTSQNIRRIAAVAIATLLFSDHAASATSEPPSPASGHAAVVAQGVVEFTDGPFHWQFTSIPATPAVASIDATAPTFVVADGPAALVIDGAAGPVARLAPGEALFVAVGEPMQVRTLAPDGGTALGVALVAGPGDASSTFTPGPSRRDVDLVRDVLNTNEALVVHTDVSAFVMVTSGAVTAGGATIATGSPTAMTGDVTLINTAPERATVVVALVGPTLGDVADPEPASSPQPPATVAPATAPPAGNPPAGTEPPSDTEPPADTAPDTTSEPAPETTVEPEPEPDPTLDSDGDGLRDTDEAGFGSDPFDPDTDNDGLNDGADRGNGCSPTSYDTDGDGFSDGSEINAGTNCAIAD